MAGRRAMCSLQPLGRSEGVTFLGRPGKPPKRETRCRASGDRKSHSECKSNNNYNYKSKIIKSSNVNTNSDNYNNIDLTASFIGARKKLRQKM